MPTKSTVNVTENIQEQNRIRLNDNEIVTLTLYANGRFIISSSKKVDFKILEELAKVTSKFTIDVASPCG